MTSFKIKPLSAMLAALVCACSPSLHAETQGFSISPMVGQAIFDNDAALEDETYLSLGLGYQFNTRWGAELVYLNAEPEVKNSNTSLDLDQFRLDVLRYFGEDKFRPYVAGGFGMNQLSQVDQDENTANIGVGALYAVNEALSLRGDIRMVRGFESYNKDYFAGVGLHYLFGQSSTASSAKTSIKPSETVLDADRDGVADSMDKCPSTAMSVKVDEFGCALDLDTDKDGVLNNVDACPDTKAGAKVDAKGCYLTLTENVSVNLQVNFANNSAEVVEGAYAEVKRVADFMRQYPQTNVVIEGHTDDRGAAEYNRSLSQKRADAVAKILTEHFGVNKARVSSKGYGESKPLFDNSTAANRAKNRRVVAVVSASVEKVQR